MSKLIGFIFRTLFRMAALYGTYTFLKPHIFKVSEKVMLVRLKAKIAAELVENGIDPTPENINDVLIALGFANATTAQQSPNSEITSEEFSQQEAY